MSYDDWLARPYEDWPSRWDGWDEPDEGWCDGCGAPAGAPHDAWCPWRRTWRQRVGSWVRRRLTDAVDAVAAITTRAWCAVRGHEDQLVPTPDRTYVWCARCRRRSAGVAVGRRVS